MTSATSPLLVVLYGIIGSGFLVLMGYGFCQFMGLTEDDPGIQPRTREQNSYMRDLRARNLQILADEAVSARMHGHYGRGWSGGRASGTTATTAARESGGPM